MSIISYSQNLEDVMLWRALKNIEHGFYIDIGANHPSIDSVTKLFYSMGWNGINVEPEDEYYHLLESERNKDINVNVAINSSGEPIEFYVSDVRGWSTTDEEGLFNLERKHSLKNKITVPGLTLDELCMKYVSSDVHFLKIDVEGAEKDVLESFSFDSVRPWIIVIEATKPTTQIDVSHEWESILFENQYGFVYFDGLNKFYVADEHKEIGDKLRIPPNVFDDYLLSSQHEAMIERDIEAEKNKLAESCLVDAKNKLQQFEVILDEAVARAQIAESKLKSIQNQVSDIQNSVSWKATAPLRYISKKLKKQ
ncbi:FkbM family methyltransferase [Vibrio sp. 10N.261.54.A5]|uniref:FkbM family methyltransferase n=1 Tax=Vibrio sp. 10N.261.54.A5 TaxID=3229686 RepID=UPI0035540D58